MCVYVCVCVCVCVCPGGRQQVASSEDDPCELQAPVYLCVCVCICVCVCVCVTRPGAHVRAQRLLTCSRTLAPAGILREVRPLVQKLPGVAVGGAHVPARTLSHI